jgi:hypothetical protein
MKYIFFYSQLYEYFYNHIHDNIKSFFDLEAIKIDNLTNNSNHTFFGGVSIKIELIIQKIKENMGNSIIFTDATIFINFNNSNKLVEFFNIYTNNDLCFSDNEGGGHKYNIGIILINCNIKTLSFFENVLDDLINKKGWDQDVINNHLCNNNNLKVGLFDKEKIYCGWEFNPQYMDTYLIYKSFIHHDTNIIKNFNNRLDIFKRSGLITNEEHHANFKNE